ncbi:MAG TPA: transporter substrate-binding domain-containing protein [Opitutaceae bacterium]|nr:transporter substrate-binding domain-containing protein [Opitutaceae bacterium]
MSFTPWRPSDGIGSAFTARPPPPSPMRFFVLRYIFFTLGFFIEFLFAVPTPCVADGLDRIYSRNVLRAAVPQDFPPFGSVDTALDPIGYDIDVARLFAKTFGVKLELVPVASANRILYLKTHKVDVIISNLGKSPERAKVIDFSEAYAPYFNGVFAPEDIAVGKFEDLAGHTIGVTRGTFEDLQVSQAAPKTTAIKRYDDNNSTIAAFMSGQVELVGIGSAVAATILKQNPPKRPELKFLIKDSPCSIGIDQGEPRLLAKINEIIRTEKMNGELNALSQQWFGAPLPVGL